MGRKGMKGFLKSAGKAHASDEEEEATPKRPQAATKATGHSTPSATAAPAVEEAAPHDPPEEGGSETRGHMLQRHKREMLAHKKALQRGGKKSKDEVAKFSKEIEDRHARELAEMDAGNPAPAADAPAAAAVAVGGSSNGARAGGPSVAAAPASTAGSGAAGEADRASKFLAELSLAPASSASRKASKAQKRKEKRAAEDAEREARIAAELSELGTTERMAEEAALKALLQPLGLVVKEIRADGHCLYRSIEDQLEQKAAAGGGGEGGAEDEEEEVPNYQELREMAAEYIRSHKEDFLPFLLPEDQEENAEDYLEKYCYTLETTAAWGGHVELTALAKALQRQISVYATNMPVVTVGEEFVGEGKGAPLQVCYLQHAFGLGEHYNSVKALRMRVTFADEVDVQEIDVQEVDVQEEQQAEAEAG